MKGVEGRPTLKLWAIILLRSSHFVASRRTRSALLRIPDCE